MFESPVDNNEFPTYKDYIINPMSLSVLEKNIKRKMYGSTEAFVADASWIVHNCIIFNSCKLLLILKLYNGALFFFVFPSSLSSILIFSLVFGLTSYSP